MKPTAKNIANYINELLDKPVKLNGKEYPRGNNVSIYLPKLNENTLNALKNNYNFKVVRREFFGYVHFER